MEEKGAKDLADALRMVPGESSTFFQKIFMERKRKKKLVEK